MLKRTFFIGDEWLYYKVYCGVKTADIILAEVVKPLTEEFIKNNIIDKWFFIRYSDPKTHLRIRFHLVSPENIFEITYKVNQFLQNYVKMGLVWKIMTDTYNREVERYGNNTIELAENLFYNDSVLTVGIVSLIQGDEGENIRWLVGLRSIDEFINDFGYSLEQKFELLTIMKDSFAKEYNMDKYLKIQLGDKFRKQRKFIESILNTQNDKDSDLQSILYLIKQRGVQNKPIVESIIKLKNKELLEDLLNNYMWSYLHMLNNRLFKSKQRTHELVIYYFLYQFYKSKLAQMGRKFR